MSEQSTEQTLETIELSMEAVQEHITLAHALQRLENNEFFKKLFLDKYLNSYAVRLVKLKASMGMQTPEHQKNIDNQLLGIGQMHQFMLYVRQEGQLAEKALEDWENEREMLLAENEVD